MVDISRWYECVNEDPKKRGKYLLLVGLRDKQSGATNIGIIESFWNGHAWDCKEEYIPMKWRYNKPNEICKYPDFEKNNRRVKL